MKIHLFALCLWAVLSAFADIDGLLATMEDSSAGYRARIAAIHSLPPDMSEGQIGRCHTFLRSRLERQPLADLEFNALKNELVFVLMRQNHGTEGLAGLLLEMYRDNTMDIIWRDYCLQFFGKWYPRAPRNQWREEMADELWLALREGRRGRLAGTAASQLAFLSGKYPAFPQEKVAARCLEALLSPDCAVVSQVALLQACAELGCAGALPFARSLAENGRDAIARASAIAAVGMLGDASDIPLLERLAESNDMRVNRPAAAALARLRK